MQSSTVLRIEKDLFLDLRIRQIINVYMCKNKEVRNICHTKFNNNEI